MASFVDSVAEFRSKVEQLDLGELWPAFKRARWITISRFAFAPSYAPGTYDEARFRSGILDRTLGNGVVEGTEDVRRLQYECYGHTVHHNRGTAGRMTPRKRRSLVWRTL